MKPITLKNGFRVHLVPFAGTDAATVFVLFKVGSRYEQVDINGAAHFLEHLMFKGTKRRPTTQHISRALDAIGAEYNAFTSKNWTGYYIKAEASHVPLAVDMLHDMVFHSVFDEKEMDRERGVIIEEINMYRDNPVMRVEELLEEKLFEGSPLGWDIGGTAETMRSMTRERVLEFRKQYYRPDRAVIAIAGKIDHSILPTIKKTFGAIPTPKGKSPEFLPAMTAAPSKQPRTIVEYKDTKQIQVALGYPSFAIGDKRNFALTLLGNILGGTMSSRLFVQVRERRGLCYRIRAGNSPMEDIGTFTIQAGLETARLPLAMKTILAEAASIVKKGVTARELKEAKENIRGRLLLSMEDSSGRTDWVAQQELFLPEVKMPADYLKEINKVTAAQVKAAAKAVLHSDRLTIAAIGPFKDEAAFLAEAGLKG